MNRISTQINCSRRYGRLPGLSLWISVILCWPVLAGAQGVLDLSVSGSYNQQSALSVLEAVEAAYPVRFYFDATELPENTFTFTLREEATLKDLLDELFGQSMLGYMPYRDHAIILLPRSIIAEDYSADFYRTLEAALQAPEETEAQEQTLVVGSIQTLRPDGRALVRGLITDAKTGDPIIGATVLWADHGIGTTTDEDGRFEVELPNGEQELQVRYVGYKDVGRLVKVLGDGKLALEMSGEAIALEEVVVKARAADANVESAQIGVARIDVQSLKKLPALLGETDLVNSLLLNPGVSTIGEGATGFNVRGGNADQNLLLQDEGFIFNASHALGFFSTFNTDLINSAELYKGNIPAQFGGRLASVLDVEMRDGDFEQFGIKGGIGPIASRLSVEGPVIKDKSSFLLGGRLSYADWFLNLVKVPEVNRSSAFFYDLNLRYTHKFDDKNTLILSGYSSDDDFSYNREFGFDYGTRMGQLIYRKIFSDNVFSKFSATYSRYNSTQTDFAGVDATTLDNSLSYLKAKEQLTITSLENIRLDAGLSAIYYWSDPGDLEPFGEASQVTSRALERERALESAIFLNAEWELSPSLLLSGGLRVGLYQFLGPKTIFLYENDLPNGPAAITDTLAYDDGKTIAGYSSLEPRFSLRYRFSANSSVKAGYSRTAQYINQVFNADSPTPSSIWQLSTPYIQPTRSHNTSVGYFRNFQNNTWETSAEIYYRWMDHILDYRDFADLVANEHLETELLSGVGRAYGLELSIKKISGMVNGWLSYTYSRSERLIEGINRDNWYPSNFDQPHSLSLILNFQPNQRNTFTLSFNYNQGRPTTPPVGTYEALNGLDIPLYTDRNQLRIPDYHRLDIAYTLGQGYNRTKRIKTSWTLAIYNVYGRKNAYSVFFTKGAFQQVEANKLSVLGSMLPSLTLNFEFQ